MPKMKVERSTDYRLTAMIRGEMAAQNVSVEKASRYAGCCVNTLYKIFGDCEAARAARAGTPAGADMLLGRRGVFVRDGAGADGVRGAAAGADLRRGGGGGGCGRERTV